MPTDIDILRKIDRIHPYPAKFPVDLAMNYISKYTNIGNTVYDPFVGSGTTLLASRALERNAYGTDVNHIAVLISQFKLLSLSQNDIKECKANIADSQNDAEKLNEFITNPEKMKGLEKLYHKVTNGKEKFDISIGIGAKTSPAARALDVDYIFMFDIDDTAIDKTVVRYNIAIIDTALINKFSPLINENGKLAGELSYPEIYVIQ